jgi:hypothetical protein
VSLAGRYSTDLSVTPGSLTSWSVQVLRRSHRSTPPASTSNAAIKPNALAPNRRFPIDRHWDRWSLLPPARADCGCPLTPNWLRPLPCIHHRRWGRNERLRVSLWNTCHPSETTVGPAIGACSDSGTSTTPNRASRHNLDHRGDLQRRLHSLQSRPRCVADREQPCRCRGERCSRARDPASHSARSGPSAPVRCGDGPV